MYLVYFYTKSWRLQSLLCHRLVSKRTRKCIHYCIAWRTLSEHLEFNGLKLRSARYRQNCASLRRVLVHRRSKMIRLDEKTWPSSARASRGKCSNWLRVNNCLLCHSTFFNRGNNCVSSLFEKTGAALGAALQLHLGITSICPSTQHRPPGLALYPSHKKHQIEVVSKTLKQSRLSVFSKSCLKFHMAWKHKLLGKNLELLLAGKLWKINETWCRWVVLY